MENGTQLSMYDEMAARHNAAYTAFRTIYEAKLPAPKEPVVERDSIFVPAALIVMICASILVSGSRTVAEFGGGIIGLAAFLMLEGAIIAYAFFRTRRNFNEERMESVQTLANIGLGMAFAVTVAVAVNVILKGENETHPTVKTVIHLLVAVSAPTLAFISGDILAVETMADSSKKRKAKEKYEADLADWGKGLNEAWAAEKSRWGVSIKVEREPVHVHPNPSNGQSIGQMDKPMLPSASTLGHSKKPNASVIVREYLAAHEEAIEMDARDLAVLLEVGKSTVNNVQREFRERKSN